MDAEKPRYRDGQTCTVPKIKEGEILDVISLLSSPKRDYLVRANGDIVVVEALKGKYVLVCCLLVPVSPVSSEAAICLAMIVEYNSLCTKNIEMVVVVKMRHASDLDESGFNHFLSAFPCLAIPFSDWECRDRVCKSARLSHYMTGFLLDPHHKVLRCGDLSFVSYYGADCFPYCESDISLDWCHLRALRYKLNPIFLEYYTIPNIRPTRYDVDYQNHINYVRELPPVSLLDLLHCSPSVILRNPKGQRVSVGELSKKIVGVYLCAKATFMDELNDICYQCRVQNLEFEILLVCMDIYEDPICFKDQVHAALRLRNISSWWLFPHPETICRRLWRLINYDVSDKLIVMRPPGKPSELAGEHVIRNFGIKAYPFTRESLHRRRFNKLRSFNLIEMLRTCGVNYLFSVDGGSQVSVSELDQKPVLLYLDDYKIKHTRLCKELRVWCTRHKYKDVKVVYVPLHTGSGRNGTYDKWVRFMHWLTVPLDSASSVVNQLFLKDERVHSTLVAFGEDGLIVSRNAELEELKYDFWPVANNLRRQIADDIVLEEDDFSP